MHLITLNDKYTLGRTPLEEGSARLIHLYLTKHNTHSRQTDIHASYGIRTCNPQQASGIRHTPYTRAVTIRPLCGKQTGLPFISIPCTVHISLFCTLTKKCTQLFHKSSHCYMFRHYCVILRKFVINTLPSYSKYFKCSCW